MPVAPALKFNDANPTIMQELQDMYMARIYGNIALLLSLKVTTYVSTV